MAQQRTVLVTGCSVGIGRATALYLAQRGWHVFATARRVHLLEQIASAAITPLYLDLNDPASCEAAVAEVLRHTGGRLDALVNNAGSGVLGVLEETPLDEARKLFETNVLGTLRMCQLVAPVMRAQGGGRIVNVSSIAGFMGFPMIGAYCATKAALISFADTLRVELRPWNIKVITVAPGVVQSEWFSTTHKNTGATLATRPDTPYAPFYRTYLKLLPTLTGTQVPPAETVARMIHRALTARWPKVYMVGPGPLWPLLRTAKQVLPASWLDAALALYFWRE